MLFRSQVTLYTVLVILALLFLDLAYVKDCMLALLPVALGLTWMIAFMNAFGISFNLANFFALPMLIGTGVDGGIHMLKTFHEKNGVIRR